MEDKRKQQLEKFVKSLKDDEVRDLYKQLGHRLNLMIRAKELYAMKDFNVLDRVVFHNQGQHFEGTITKINQRTISVITIEGENWNVNPRILKKLCKPTDPIEIFSPLAASKDSKKIQAEQLSTQTQKTLQKEEA